MKKLLFFKILAAFCICLTHVGIVACWWAIAILLVNVKDLSLGILGASVPIGLAILASFISAFILVFDYTIFKKGFTEYVESTFNP